jgi:hypothetical protein
MWWLVVDTKHLFQAYARSVGSYVIAGQAIGDVCGICCGDCAPVELRTVGCVFFTWVLVACYGAAEA